MGLGLGLGPGRAAWKPAQGLARKEQGGSTSVAWSGVKMPNGGAKGEEEGGKCVILHPDGWFQQQLRQVNSGAEARQAPYPGSVLVTTLVKA